MSAARQIEAVTMMNLRMIPARFGTSLVICIGIAGVVAVLIAVLAMAKGLTKTITSAARGDRVSLVAGGEQPECCGATPREGMLAIKPAPGIATPPDGNPAVSPEVL